MEVPAHELAVRINLPRGTVLQSTTAATSTHVSEVCSRAGGVSIGAQAAGFNIEHAIEYESLAAGAYKDNTGVDPIQKVLSGWVEEKLNLIANGAVNLFSFVVTFLHLSPPCQPISIANRDLKKTTNIIKGLLQLKTICQVEPCIYIFRPRYITLEESPALLHHDPVCLDGPQKIELLRLVSWLLKAGYSVQLRVINMADFGVPQGRESLFIMASG
jgi:DNA (cytosine-5)-methyltransferase 1